MRTPNLRSRLVGKTRKGRLHTYCRREKILQYVYLYTSCRHGYYLHLSRLSRYAQGGGGGAGKATRVAHHMYYHYHNFHLTRET